MIHPFVLAAATIFGTPIETPYELSLIRAEVAAEVRAQEVSLSAGGVWSKALNEKLKDGYSFSESRWHDCLVEATNRFLRQDEPAAEVVEAAFGHCISWGREHQEWIDLWDRSLGKAAKPSLTGERMAHTVRELRPVLIAWVLDTRSKAGGASEATSAEE